MRFDDLDLSDFPVSPVFTRMVEKQSYLLAGYNPTTLEADIPFYDDWWKYLYWMPTIKKEFYVMAMSAPNFDQALVNLCKKYGMDFWFFSIHFKFFIKRLEWMRKQETTKIGEVRT